MFSKCLNSLVCAGLVSLSTANIAQAESYRFYPNSNPGVHRTLIISNQGRYSPIPSVIPQRNSGSYNPYYPGYYNPYYLRPIHPTQEVIIIHPDRYPDNNGNYPQNHYERLYEKNWGYHAPYGDPDHPSYPYYNHPR